MTPVLVYLCFLMILKTKLYIWLQLFSFGSNFFHLATTFSIWRKCWRQLFISQSQPWHWYKWNPLATIWMSQIKASWSLAMYPSCTNLMGSCWSFTMQWSRGGHIIDNINYEIHVNYIPFRLLSNPDVEPLLENPFSSCGPEFSTLDSDWSAFGTVLKSSAFEWLIRVTWSRFLTSDWSSSNWSSLAAFNTGRIFAPKGGVFVNSVCKEKNFTILLTS